MNTIWSPQHVQDVERYREAIRVYRRKHGLTMRDLGKLLQVSNMTISRWLSGGGIATRHLPTIERLCGKYMTEEHPADRATPMAEDKAQTNTHAESNVTPIGPDELVSVPIVDIAQAAGYEPAVEPLHDFLSALAGEEYPWSEAKTDYFALRVEGTSMCPDYPPGTLLLVAGGEYPQRGDIVVAKLATGEVVVKEYSRKDNTIHLQAIHDEGRSYTWHVKENPGYVVWMFPVIRAEIDLRRRRWEQHKNGKSLP